VLFTHVGDAPEQGAAEQGPSNADEYQTEDETAGIECTHWLSSHFLGIPCDEGWCGLAKAAATTAATAATTATARETTAPTAARLRGHGIGTRLNDRGNGAAQRLQSSTQ